MNADSPARAKYFRTLPWVPYLWLAVVTYLLYFKTLAYSFTFFTDFPLIAGNLHYLENIGNVVDAFTRGTFSPEGGRFYRPVLIGSLIIDTQWNWLSFFHYHATNVLLHAAAACLFYLLLTKENIGRVASLALATVFAVHPALSPAVAWIPGRSESLLAVFVIASFIFFIAYLSNGRRTNLLLHLLLFALALVSNETAALFPLVTGLYFVLRGKAPPGVVRGCIVLWAAVLVTWHLFRAHFLGYSPFAVALPPAGYLSAIIPAVASSIGTAVLPVQLSILPRMAVPWQVYAAAAAAAGIAVAYCSGRKPFPSPVLFGIGWFVLFALPVSATGDHRLYLPMAGALLAVAQAVPRQINRPSRWLAAALALSVNVLFACAAFHHSDRYAGRMIFWENAAKDAPASAEVKRHLAAIYREYGFVELAQRLLEEAVRADPSRAQARLDLAMSYRDRNMFDEADREFKAALRADPSLDAAYALYAGFCASRGRAAEAETLWKRAIEMNRDLLPAYRDLVAHYFEERRYADAVRSIRRIPRHAFRRPELFTFNGSMKRDKIHGNKNQEKA